MDFEVSRQDFRQTRVVDEPSPPLADGQIRLAIERWAFTTNNITYAVAGDMLDYWSFFPAHDPWGRIPAMGLGSVVESAHPEIAAGGRFFGMFPMADELVIDAVPRPNGFRDVGVHRANHAGFYVDFTDVASDAMFREEQVDEYLLLRGMFMTSFLIDDQLADRGFEGAGQTLVTSASSKTSICLAACLRQRGHHSIGLTSERNRSFVEGLGLYDEVTTYDEIGELDRGVASALVDMAGSTGIRSDVHTQFGDELRVSLTVGATHWEDPADPAGELPGPTPEFFFAPGQSAKRVAEWGEDGLATRMATAFHAVLDDTRRWLTVVHHTGPGGVESTYRTLLEGQAEPSIGYVVSMRKDSLA